MKGACQALTCAGANPMCAQSMPDVLVSVQQLGGELGRGDYEGARTPHFWPKQWPRYDPRPRSSGAGAAAVPRADLGTTELYRPLLAPDVVLQVLPQDRP